MTTTSITFNRTAEILGDIYHYYNGTHLMIREGRAIIGKFFVQQRGYSCPLTAFPTRDGAEDFIRSNPTAQLSEIDRTLEDMI